MIEKGRVIQDRLDVIFQGLRKGKNANEIYGALDSNPTLIDGFSGIDERGVESLTRVYRSLIQLPSVEEINFVTPNSKRDVSGVDLDVYFKKGFVDYIRAVGVQVKSNVRHIYQFENSMRRRLGLSWIELKRWFLRQKLVILNGQEEPQNITDGFLMQLHEIQNFHDPHTDE